MNDGGGGGERNFRAITRLETLATQASFFVHFFAVTTRLQYDVKLPNFYGRRAMNFETAR